MRIRTDSSTDVILINEHIMWMRAGVMDSGWRIGEPISNDSRVGYVSLCPNRKELSVVSHTNNRTEWAVKSLLLRNVEKWRRWIQINSFTLSCSIHATPAPARYIWCPNDLNNQYLIITFLMIWSFFFGMNFDLVGENIFRKNCRFYSRFIIDLWIH